MSDQVKTQGTIVVGPYKGYAGRAEYDSDDGDFHGEVSGTRDVITFQGATVDEIGKAFVESVDDYLAFCAARNEPAEKPVSGRFVVRVPPQLHRQLVMLANLRGTSLNGLIEEILGNTASQFQVGSRHSGGLMDDLSEPEAECEPD